jgi:hypothetical protein
MPITEWCHYSGMSRSSTYNDLGRGNLRAIKMGARTLIDVEYGDSFLNSLPAAKIRAPPHRDR